MSALAEALAAHASYGVTRGLPCCKCKWVASDRNEKHADHVAAAVTDWLTERLASDEVREAVVWAVSLAYYDDFDDTDGIGGHYATAALTAVTAALRGES